MAMTIDGAFMEDAEKLLDRLLLQEVDNDLRLEQFLDPDIQPDLTSLLELQSSLQIEEQLSRLSERIDPAAETAKGLRERVRKLDMEQGRVKECLKYVEDVQELKVFRTALYAIC